MAYCYACFECGGLFWLKRRIRLSSQPRCPSCYRKTVRQSTSRRGHKKPSREQQKKGVIAMFHGKLPTSKDFD